MAACCAGDLAMVYEFKLSGLHGARVRLVLTLHQKISAPFLHPVITFRWWDRHCLAADLELTALVVFDETRHYHLTLLAQ